MAITKVIIKDFLVFKGEFAPEFCPGVNVLIGGNGTGKTTLLKIIYNSYSLFRGESLALTSRAYLPYFTCVKKDVSPKIFSDSHGLSWVKDEKLNAFAVYFSLSEYDYLSPNEKNMRQIAISASYIPEKDILEHAKGLLTFIEQKETGFSPIFKNVLVAAMDVPTREQTSVQKSVGEKIVDIIGGTIAWDEGEGSFYTMRKDGTHIPFANEASGFKKLGYLGLLVASGQLRPGTVLFWDEPENSLNPELIPMLVEILLELQRNGVQIFIATHSEMLSNEFSISRKNSDEVKFFSLYKDENGEIKADTDTRFDLLHPNKLTQASVEQYEREIERGLNGSE
ncbi:MAG: AAA family ATPase [Oscillospiraceae bacterium]|jgi:AAA15 family ATPase/GTPase|nr:AAA family ATPase [Oscillospiraceae bacterium]